MPPNMHAGKGDHSRERNFIGVECAVCEEPLEHMLRGERVLALACGHSSHEACFYELIKEFETQECPTCDAPLRLDTSRGGGIDFDNLNKLVRSAQAQDSREHSRESYRETKTIQTAWESDTIRQSIRNQERVGSPKPSRHHLLPELNRSPDAFDRLAASHGRNQSGDTGLVSSGGWSDSHHANNARFHDYDVQSIESALSSPRHLLARNPIPTPTVTIKSEFPTLNKSRQQQSLTCLVTVEVPDGKWRPSVEDFRRGGPVPAIPEEAVAPTKSPPTPTMSPSPKKSQRPVDSIHEDVHALEEAKEELYKRMDDWHGLNFPRFGRLLLHGVVRVGKDTQSWQLLECYLFAEMLICVKEKKVQPSTNQNQWSSTERRKCTLKGSILIQKHLKKVEVSPDSQTLTLSLSVTELPQFHLQFLDRPQMETWRKALASVNAPVTPPEQSNTLETIDQDTSGTDEEEYSTTTSGITKRPSSMHSSTFGASRSQATAPTEYTNSRIGAPDIRMSVSPIHVPVDIVVVVPVSSSTQGLKINLLRDSLRFLVSSLGERDRLGLVTFGSGAGGVPLVNLAAKSWSDWSKVLGSIRPNGQKSMRADMVEGTNVAMDVLMQRKVANPLSSIIVISDSSSPDQENVDFVVSRAEAAKIPIHTFGLGLSHKPDTLVELSDRTKAVYTYVKDWMGLRECLAGCVGTLQSTSHQNVKVKLRLPEGSPAKLVKISGALTSNKRTSGREAEATLGDLRFGDKRDILVQLSITPDASSSDSIPSDPWENVIAGLEALGGGSDDDKSRSHSVEEVPLIQADLNWGDLLRDGTTAQLSRPSLLAITILPPLRKASSLRPATPPIPPHPSVVQRRMELLTSDMLSRSLTLVSRNQHDRAYHLLAETRTILKGLGKGGLPPLPPPPSHALPAPPTGSLPPSPAIGSLAFPPTPRSMDTDSARVTLPEHRRTPSPPTSESHLPFSPSISIDNTTMAALDDELAASLEWISHPAVFGRDSRKSVLQAIGTISSQRSFTFRTSTESLWAARIPGVKRLSEWSRAWREATTDESLPEESWS